MVYPLQTLTIWQWINPHGKQSQEPKVQAINDDMTSANTGVPSNTKQLTMSNEFIQHYSSDVTNSQLTGYERPTV